MILTLKLGIALLSVAILVTSLLSPSADQSLEGVFNGHTDNAPEKPWITKLVWIFFILWLIDAILLAILA